MNKIIMFIIGAFLTILGVGLILKEWIAVGLVFKGVIGGLLAVVGLVILFAATIKEPHD